jgi:hypothetical protein
MKNMNKRDIADIVLLVIGFTFVLAFLRSLAGIAFYIGTPDQHSIYINRSVGIVFSILSSLVLFGFSFMLLFRRDTFINLTFTKDSDKSIALTDSLAPLASYSFWIRIVGIYILLKSFTRLLSSLAADLTIKHELNIDSLSMRNSINEFIAVVVSLAIIMNAETIGKKLERKKDVQHAPPAGRGEAPRP